MATDSLTRVSHPNVAESGVDSMLEDSPEEALNRETSFNLRQLSIPAICKDCGKRFELPYRHFQPGIVSHCPYCRASFVPTLPMFRLVHDAVEALASRLTQGSDATSIAPLPDVARAELQKLHDALEELAPQMRPAGKMIRRKGLAAMFT